MRSQKKSLQRFQLSGTTAGASSSRLRWSSTTSLVSIRETTSPPTWRSDGRHHASWMIRSSGRSCSPTAATTWVQRSSSGTSGPAARSSAAATASAAAISWSPGAASGSSSLAATRRRLSRRTRGGPGSVAQDPHGGEGQVERMGSGAVELVRLAVGRLLELGEGVHPLVELDADGAELRPQLGVHRGVDAEQRPSLPGQAPRRLGSVLLGSVLRHLRPPWVGTSALTLPDAAPHHQSGQRVRSTT